MESNSNGKELRQWKNIPWEKVNFCHLQWKKTNKYKCKKKSPKAREMFIYLCDHDNVR